MATFEFPSISSDAADANHRAFLQLVRRYHSEPAFRRELDRHPDERLRDIGFVLPPGVQVAVVADTDEVLHIVMPSDPNIELSDETLDTVAAGGCLGTISTLSTMMCSSLVGCASTAGCASTV
jgi:hypothetical protein